MKLVLGNIALTEGNTLCDMLRAALVLGTALVLNLHTAVSEALLVHPIHHQTLTEGAGDLSMFHVHRLFRFSSFLK